METTRVPPLTNRALTFDEKRAVISRVDELLELTYRGQHTQESSPSAPKPVSKAVIGTNASVKHARRVLDRLGLIEDESGECKKKNEAFDDVLTGGRMRANLLDHGRKVCRASNPACGGCVLISFCETGRSVKLRDNRPV